MGKIIELTHDDVQNELAYALICETMEGAYWNSGRRRRMFRKPLRAVNSSASRTSRLRHTSGISLQVYPKRYA